MFSSVLLPLPEGPSSTTNSPAAISSDTSRNATTSVAPLPYVLRSVRATKIGFAGTAIGAGVQGRRSQGSR